MIHADAAVRSESTVYRHLAGLFGLYDFHARTGVALAESLVAWRRVPRGSYKPFLHHVTKGRPIAVRPVKLRAVRRLPRTLTAEEVTVVLAACTRLRDRFLIALLAETGMRIGQALGLRHSDFVTRRREVGRLRARTGIEFTPHMLRHTRATELIRGGVPIEIVAKLLTHRSVTTTSETYLHLTADDVRAELVARGVWADPALVSS